jgi:hypothetical protein
LESRGVDLVVGANHPAPAIAIIAARSYVAAPTPAKTARAVIT